MTPKSLFFAFSAIALAICVSQPAFPQDFFYKGKTIRIIVATSAGGGFDTYTRTIARYLGKHVPGQPAIVVENMPGAGGVSLNGSFISRSW